MADQEPIRRGRAARCRGGQRHGGPGRGPARGGRGQAGAGATRQGERVARDRVALVAGRALVAHVDLQAVAAQGQAGRAPAVRVRGPVVLDHGPAHEEAVGRRPRAGRGCGQRDRPARGLRRGGHRRKASAAAPGDDIAGLSPVFVARCRTLVANVDLDPIAAREPGRGPRERVGGAVALNHGPALSRRRQQEPVVRLWAHCGRGREDDGTSARLARGRRTAQGRHSARAGRQGPGRRLVGARRHLDPGLIHGLELRRGDRLQLADELRARGRAPPVVGRALEVPVGAVVGQDEAVVLEGLQHDLGIGREARQAERRAQPEPRAHGRVGRAARARLVRGRPDVGARAVRGESDRVADRPGLDLVRPEQERRDRQSRRVGRGEADGPHRVRGEIPHRAGPGGRLLPGAEVLQVVDLVELAAVLVDHDRVPVAR